MKIKNGEFLNGDCLELMKNIPDGSVDMILCDLPYGTTNNTWDSVIPFEPLWEQYWRITKENAAIVLTAQCPFDKILGCSQIKYLKYEWFWIKPTPTGFLNANRAPLKNTENVLVFYKKQPTYNPQMRQGFKPYKASTGNKSTSGNNYGAFNKVETVSNGERYPISTLEFANETGIHPTQKPVELFEYLIKTYTNKGETILDNTAGSGTTAIAAENTDRKWICMEMNEEYYKLATDRVANHTKPLEDIVNDGLFEW